MSEHTQRLNECEFGRWTPLFQSANWQRSKRARGSDSTRVSSVGSNLSEFQQTGWRACVLATAEGNVKFQNADRFYLSPAFQHFLTEIEGENCAETAHINRSQTARFTIIRLASLPLRFIRFTIVPPCNLKAPIFIDDRTLLAIVSMCLQQSSQ